MSSKPLIISQLHSGYFYYNTNSFRDNNESDLDYIEVTLNGLTFRNEGVSADSQYYYENLEDGVHTISFSAVDLVGNRSTPLTYTWIVSDMDSTITVIGTPPEFSNSTSADIYFSTAISGVYQNFVWVLTNNINNTSVSGTSTVDGHIILTGLNDYGYTLTISYDIVVGDFVLPQQVVYTWYIDTNLPDVILLGVQPFYEIALPNTFSFSASSDEVCTYSFELSGSLGVETSSYGVSAIQYNDLSGKYVVSVNAKDLSGNISPKYSYSFEVETDPVINAFSLQSVYYSEAITGVSGTGNALVEEYILTDSLTAPSVNDIQWSSSVPTNYTIYIED